MKGILLIVLMFATIASVSAQYVNTDATFHSGYTSLSGSSLSKRYDAFNIQKGFNPPGSRMAKLGKTFTVIGGALIVGGILVSSGAKTTTTYSNGVYYQDNSQEVLGIVMIIYGVGFTIPGAILWSKGAKKMRWYEQQQELTLHLKGAGLGLAYKF